MSLERIDNQSHLISGSANIRGSASSILPREDVVQAFKSWIDWCVFKTKKYSIYFYLIFLCLQLQLIVIWHICNKINGPLNDYEILFEFESGSGLLHWFEMLSMTIITSPCCCVKDKCKKFNWSVTATLHRNVSQYKTKTMSFIVWNYHV